MASTTRTTAVELSSRNNITSTDPQESSSVIEDDTTDILAASRLADSTVPEGGYGWVVIFACSVITFWFVGTTYAWVCDLLRYLSITNRPQPTGNLASRLRRRESRLNVNTFLRRVSNSRLHRRPRNRQRQAHPMARCPKDSPTGNLPPRNRRTLRVIHDQKHCRPFRHRRRHHGRWC
jgi:hypothetical protein